jgi:branched-chain amino acid aminotransferase
LLANSFRNPPSVERAVSFPKTEKIWHNGKLINWDDAHIHVLSHVVSYGSAVFEGIRAYATPQGPAIFRNREHMQRLLNSAYIYRMEVPFNVAELCEANIELVRANKVQSCYLRPIVLRGYGSGGVDPAGNPIEVYLACWEWGRYLGDEAMKSGVDVCVSSWNRPAPNTLPQMAKAAANYMNSQLIRMEAVANGYVEGIALDTNGQVSEGSGENLFVVHNGSLITPPLANSALPGITRDTVMTIARDLGIGIAEQVIPREMLYISDEVFFSGTAAEVTPIRSIDRIKIGSGARGPVTKRIQDEFFALVTGAKPDRHGWLSHVAASANAGVSR